MIALRTIGLAGLCFATLGQLQSCGSSNPSPEIRSTEGAEPAAASSPRTIVIGPSSAETLFWLGLGHHLLAVSDFCEHTSATKLPRVGGQLNPNLELIAELEPELVLVQGQHPQLETWCELNGVRYQAFKTQSLAAWHEEVVRYGELFQVQEHAQQMLSRFDEQLNQIATSTTDLTETPSPTVPPTQPAHWPRTLIVAYRKPDQIAGITVATQRTFLGELLEKVGGQNIYADHPRDYFELDAEALLVVQPEVILELGSDADPQRRLELWRRDFPTLPATRNDRIYGLTDYRVYLPGPGMLETARLMREAIR